MDQKNQKNPFLEELKQPDNMATLLVLAGALAQGQNNPGTVAQKVGGALMFRGELDNVRDARTRQEEADQLNEDKVRSEIQGRQDSAEIARQDVAVRQRQVAVDEAGLASSNRLKTAQADYYDRLPQEQRAALDVARLNWQTKRSEFYQNWLLEAQKGYNSQLAEILKNPMGEDAKIVQAKAAQLGAHFARSTEAVAQLRSLEEQTGEMGYLSAQPDGTWKVQHRLYRDPVAAAGGATLAAVPPPGEAPPVAPKPERADDALKGVSADQAAADKKRKEAEAKKKATEADVAAEYEKLKNADEGRLRALLQRKNLDPATRAAAEQALRTKEAKRQSTARTGGGLG